MTQSALHTLFLASAALVASASIALLSGCKGNTSAAASLERTVAAPPLVQAYAAGTNAAMSDPLAGGCWANARWLPLLAPSNTERTTAPVTAATLYDANCLYVAFVSNAAPGNASVDSVSVFLDTSVSRNGADMLQVTVRSDGLTNSSWIRDAEPPVKAREDGSPDLFHPVSRIPTPIAGLRTSTTASIANGTPVWTAVVGIPLKSLPSPLRTAAAPGARWKVNLVRTTVLADNGNGAEQLQANLSPIYVASQPVSPYRMADLELAPASSMAEAKGF